MIQDIAPHVGAINEDSDVQPEAVLVVEHLTAYRRIARKDIGQRRTHRCTGRLHRAARSDVAQVLREVDHGHGVMVQNLTPSCKQSWLLQRLTHRMQPGLSCPIFRKASKRVSTFTPSAVR